MTAKNTQLKLYKIDKNLFPDTPTEKFIEKIIAKANKNASSNKKFEPQTKHTDFSIPEGFTFTVYHAIRDSKPGWVDAWTEVIAENQKMLSSTNKMSSFIAFISLHDNLYALTGGQGNFVIGPYIESFFGLDVIDHLIDSTHSSALSEATKRAVTGNIKTEQRTFYSLTDAFSQDSYETFFQNLKSKINRDYIVKYFSEFYPNRDYNSFFQGGDYFLVRKAIPVKKVFDLILAVSNVLTERKSSGHNKLIPIGSVGSDSPGVEALNEALLKDIFQNRDNADLLDNYYFVPKGINADKIDSSVFAIATRKDRIEESAIFTEVPRISQYISNLSNLNNRKKNFKTYNDLKDAIKDAKIYWKPVEDEDFNHFDAFASINGILEVPGRQKSFLRFEGKWYEMRQNFKDIVNQEFKSLVQEESKVIDSPDFLNKWKPGDDEDTYNYSHIDTTNVLVSHRAIKAKSEPSFMEQHVEYSDLIHLNEETPKMIHVKKLCNGEMRVASAQVLICGKLLNQASQDGFFREYYRQILSMANTSSQTSKITEEDFVKLGMGEKMHICLAISDRRVLENDPKLSLCGKFYFIKMFKDMADLGYHSNRFYVMNV